VIEVMLVTLIVPFFLAALAGCGKAARVSRPTKAEAITIAFFFMIKPPKLHTPFYQYYIVFWKRLRWLLVAFYIKQRAMFFTLF
jgi:hypothetical protein